MEMIVIAVHMAKSNKQQQVDDYRALDNHVDILRDPKNLLGILWCLRLFIGDGAPMPESWIESLHWCVHARLLNIYCLKLIVCLSSVSEWLYEDAESAVGLHGPCPLTNEL
jgi:hypothetical protein